jgi:hypothetical protein
VYSTPPNRIWQATWNDALSSRLLFTFGYSAYNNRWGGFSAPGNPTRDMLGVTEQGGSIPGLCYRGAAQVRRVPVVDELGRCVGMISQAFVAWTSGKRDLAELVRETSRDTCSVPD